MWFPHLTREIQLDVAQHLLDNPLKAVKLLLVLNKEKSVASVPASCFLSADFDEVGPGGIKPTNN